MSRRNPKPEYALPRMMQGMFRTYLDKNIPERKAKIRMYKETYDACLMLARKEEEYHEHILIATMQHSLSHLNLRGQQLTNKLKQDDANEDDIKQALQDLKKVKDSLEHFITTYKGEANV